MKVQIEVTRPRWLTLGTRYRKLKTVGVALAATLAVAVPVAWASHDFGDVPDGHQFHGPISAIKGAGITTGCGGGNYCPDDSVRRDAMAAFMQRGFGRVSRNWTSTGLTNNAYTAILSTSLTAGATGSGNGFALVQAQLGACTSTPANCVCQIEFRIRNATTGALGPTSLFQVGNVADEDGFAMDNGAVSAVFSLPAGATHAYELQVNVDDSNGVLNAFADMTAAYVPFGPQGFNSLGSSAVTSSAKADLP